MILARELDLINEFEDINIQKLISENLLSIDKEEFISRLEEVDIDYQNIKENQEQGYVLRYVGDLHGDLSKDKGELDVKLVSAPVNSALGQLKGSDSIFEIYTESYGENPIVIMGAGAGAATGAGAGVSALAAGAAAVSAGAGASVSIRHTTCPTATESPS